MNGESKLSNIGKIIIYIIFGILFFVGWLGWICCLKKEGSSFKKCINRFKNFFKKNWRAILWIMVYLTLVVLSSIFVFQNWDECLDMVFLVNLMDII